MLFNLIIRSNEKFMLNVRGIGHRGFIQHVHNLDNLYHSYILFPMEIKVNSNKARIIIKKFNFFFPFLIEISPIGFTGGLWIL